VSQSSQHETATGRSGRGGSRGSIRAPSLLALGLLCVKVGVILAFPLRKIAMTAWVPDDAFIFMRIARNVALGRGYSFDGVRLTSGAPQLWVWLTFPWQWLLDKNSAAKAVLMTSAFFGALASIIVFWIADRLYGRAAAWVAFALTALGLPLMLNSMNGMETSLFTCLGLLAIALYVRLRESRGTWKSYLVLGCVLGLLHLTRTDGVFLSFGIFVAELVRLSRLGPSERRAAIRELAVLVLAAAVVTLPTIVLSFKATGNPLPANQVGRRALAWEGPLGSDGRLSLAEYAAWSVFRMLSLQRLVAVATGSSVVAALGLLFGAWRGRGRRFAGIVLVYVCGFFGTLVFYQWYFPDVHGLRYLNLPAHLFAILTAGLLTYAVARLLQTRIRRMFALTVAVVLTLSTTAFQYREVASGVGGRMERRLIPNYSASAEAEWWRMVDWTAASLEPGTVVAATDHGRIAYFTDVAVIDLDGILLPQLLEHLEDGSVDEYLDESRVAYVFLPDRPEKRICRCLRETGRIEQVADVPEDADREVFRWVPHRDESIAVHEGNEG